MNVNLLINADSISLKTMTYKNMFFFSKSLPYLVWAMCSYPMHNWEKLLGPPISKMPS